MENHSILENVTRNDLSYEPYPHVIIDECLPRSYFEALAATYPSNETILEYCRTHPFRKFVFVDGEARPNDRYDISAFQALERPGHLSPIWLDFIRYHTSPAFFAEVAALFGPEISRTYPFLETSLGRALKDFSAGVRFRSDCDISLDCQVGINTPATRKSSVRRVHTDAEVELFAALLYFRAPDDDTLGGDLEIFKWRNPRKKRFVGSEADETATELVDTIRYKANRLVIFLNTQDSLHAVTPRVPSPHTRKLVNIIGEVDRSFPKGLFSRPKKKDKGHYRRKATSLGRKIIGARTIRSAQ